VKFWWGVLTAKLFFWRWAFQQKRHTYRPWYSKRLDKEMCLICGRRKWHYRHLKMMEDDDNED